METLKKFLEAKLIEVGYRNIKWWRKGDVVYVYCTNPNDCGARVTMTLAELVDDLLWQESGV